MATRDCDSSAFGRFQRVPLEVRQLMWAFYFDHAISSISMMPISTNSQGKDRYYLQPYDRDLLLVSRAIRCEALPYHRRPKLAQNRHDLRLCGPKRVGWEIPEPSQDRTITIVAHVDPIQPHNDLPEMRVHGSTLKHGQRLDLRLDVADHEVARWTKSNQLPEPLPAPAWQEVRDSIVRIFQNWVWSCPWSYTFGPEPPVIHMRKDPAFRSACGQNEIAADIECWRSSTTNNNESKTMLKSLHVVVELNSEQLVERYVAKRSAADVFAV